MSRKTLLVSLIAVVAGLVAVQLVRSHGLGLSPVVEGSVYRSRQPAPEDLRDLKAQIQLATVVNLRGPNPGADWYDEELDAARENGISMRSLTFETFDAPARLGTIALVDTLDSARRPILLHCLSGRDRSGWASGVARLLEGISLDEARAELTPLNGHFCKPSSCPLHSFFDHYESWLASRKQSSSAEAFRNWVREEYYPEPYRASLTIDAHPDFELQSGDLLRLTVNVANDSESVWPAGDDPSRGVRLGARIAGPFESLPDNPRSRFRSRHGTRPRDVWRESRRIAWPSGEGRSIDVEFPVPLEPGLWIAQVDMVDEQVHWFSDLGGPGLIVPFRVTAAED